MAVLVDGKQTRSTADRGILFNSAAKNSVAVQYNDLLNMKKDARRELVTGKEVIYIYHNAIDAIGDKVPTESKVFEACETAIQELSNILRIIVNELSGTNIFITADHGFLYTYQPLNESDKIDRKTFSGGVLELGRRYALTEPEDGYRFPAADPFRVRVRWNGYQGLCTPGYDPHEGSRWRRKLCPRRYQLAGVGGAGHYF